MSRLRIGLLGPGMIVKKAVAPAIVSSRMAQLEVIGSRSIARARAAAEQFGGRAVEGYEAVIQDPRVDVVYIALPNALHVEWIVKAARAGKHVICEKPAVLAWRDALRVIEACERSGVRFLEAYMFRFHPQHARITELIRGGILGEVFHFEAAFGFPPLSPDNFRYDVALGGGALRDAGGYPIAAARMLFEEEPEAVCATAHCLTQGGVDVQGALQLEFPSGRTAHAVYGFTNFYRNTYALWGSRGRVVTERAFSIPPDIAPSIVLTTGDGATPLPSGAEDQFRLMIDAFCEAVSSPESGHAFETEFLAQSRVSAAAWQSAQTQRRVRIKQAPRPARACMP